MSSSMSCMNNAGMANNMSKAGLPAQPVPWNGRCGGAAWCGFAGMRLAGRAAGRGAGSMGGAAGSAGWRGSMGSAAGEGAGSMGGVLHTGSIGGAAEAALNPSRTMLYVGSRSTLRKDSPTTRFSFEHVAAKLCSMENVRIPRSVMNLCDTSRMGTTQSRMSLSLPLFVGGMPGYLRNVKRLSAAACRVPANFRSPYLAASPRTSSANCMQVAVGAPPAAAVRAAASFAPCRTSLRERYRSL